MSQDKPIRPILLGCSGPVLTPEERAFFQDVNPFGFILFLRNCENPEQLRALTSALRETTGRIDTPIFVDQEGGRVARLKPPHWSALPSMGHIGALYQISKAAGLEAMRLHAMITAQRLRAVGIDGNCAPVLDIHYDGASIVMGDRTFGSDIDAIANLGRVAVDTYLAEGVYPVIKHMPGHGRVKVDPHEVLPFVETDFETLKTAEFVPFRHLKDAPMGMNCHVVFRAIDPDHPVSQSHKVHDDVIRGLIGFQGLIMTDDLAMKALSVSLPERAEKALSAGADILLYCTGVLDEMRTICADLPEITPAAWARFEKAKARLQKPAVSGEERALLARLEVLIPA